MASQDEEEVQRLLLDALDKIPSARVLVLVAAGFSGIFSSAWWLGLDSAPDRWTGTEDRKYVAEHKKKHEREESRLRKEIADLRSRAAEQEGKMREHIVRIGLNSARIGKLEDSVADHLQADEGHSGIRRNTPIILDNQEKAHTHRILKELNR